MSQKKYVSLSKLSTFLDNLYDKFASVGHKHTLDDITNYTVDSQLSSTSTNPVQNKVIDAEFEAISVAMNALESAIDGKANATHAHDDLYYTETEVDVKLDEITSILETKASADDLATHAENTEKHITATERTSWNQAALLQQVNKYMPVKGNWNAAAYGNGIYVAVTTSSDIAAYSTDGLNWTQTSLPVSTTWGCVVYGNGRFVAFATNHNYAAYSDDGINWTLITLPSNTRFDAAAYGNGMFVATSYVSKNFIYSTDGANWTKGSMPSSEAWDDIAYGNGKFVVIVRDSNVFAYSTNGTSWTTGTMPTTAPWQSITYGGGKFVATTYQSDVAAYSTDGITWTQTSLPSTQYWNDVLYGNGMFLALTSIDRVAAYSTDGITWVKSSTNYSNETWKAYVFGDGEFIAIAYNSTSVFHSTDGINWSRMGVGGVYDIDGDDVTSGVASAMKPYLAAKTHAHNHAIGGSDPITPEMIGAVSRAEWEASLLTNATVE